MECEKVASAPASPVKVTLSSSGLSLKVMVTPPGSSRSSLSRAERSMETTRQDLIKSSWQSGMAAVSKSGSGEMRAPWLRPVRTRGRR